MQVRRMAVQLHQDLDVPGRSRSVLLVTPSSGQDGCLLSVMALVKSLGEDLKQTVLLVDIAPLNPELTGLLGCDGCLGFSDLLLDENLAVESAVMPTSGENVSFLPAGRETGGVPMQALSRFLERALATFPCVVFYGGAIQDNPVNLALAPLTGLVLVFAVDHQTRKKEIEKAQQMLRFSGAERVGLVLTASEATR